MCKPGRSVGAAAERVQDGQSWNSHSIDVQVKRVAVGAWAGHFARPKWGTVPVCRKTCAVVALGNQPLHTRSSLRKRGGRAEAMKKYLFLQKSARFVDECFKSTLEFQLPERWMSGLSRTPGKRVWVNSPPRVRIPPSPPYIQ